jgi:hypothetical protein
MRRDLRRRDRRDRTGRLQQRHGSGLAVAVRGRIFGVAVGDRLLVAQALDVRRAPAAIVVDCSFATGSGSPLGAGCPTTER